MGLHQHFTNAAYNAEVAIHLHRGMSSQHIRQSVEFQESLNHFMSLVPLAQAGPQSRAPRPRPGTAAVSGRASPFQGKAGGFRQLGRLELADLVAGKTAKRWDVWRWSVLGMRSIIHS